MTAEESLLRKMGLNFESPAPGCCGMAGSFGFEEEKYDVSIAIGELELMPAIRAASPEALIIADGFSCREQIAQGSDRHALHLAEVIQLAMHGAAAIYPEQRTVADRKAAVEGPCAMLRSVATAAAIAATALWVFSRRD